MKRATELAQSDPSRSPAQHFAAMAEDPANRELFEKAKLQGDDDDDDDPDDDPDGDGGGGGDGIGIPPFEGARVTVAVEPGDI